MQASRERVRDVLFLALVSTLPAVFYVSSLGFYLDDYYELEVMSNSHDQSLWGLYTALLSGDPKSHLRPVEYFGLAVLYWLFGTDPLPYHIFLAALVPLCAVALVSRLAKLGQPRFLALGVPILFATAPHYSSDRFWVVAYSPTASLTLYLISLYCGLRALKARGRESDRLGHRCRRVDAREHLHVRDRDSALRLDRGLTSGIAHGAWGEIRLPLAAYASVLALTIATKVVLALWVGTETSYSIGGYQGGLAHHTAYMVSGAMKVNFSDVRPRASVRVGVDRRLIASAGACSAQALSSRSCTFVYLTRGARAARACTTPRGTTVAGVARVRRCGCSAHCPRLRAVRRDRRDLLHQCRDRQPREHRRCAGSRRSGDRAASTCDGVCRPERRSAAVFALAVAALAGAGVFVTNTIAGYWGSAYSRQEGRPGAARRSAASEDPAHTTVLLDGICPEIGPGIIFLGHYDLAGALRTAYLRYDIKADVMTDDVTAGRSALVINTTWLGVTDTRSYPTGNDCSSMTGVAQR